MIFKKIYLLSSLLLFSLFCSSSVRSEAQLFLKPGTNTTIGNEQQQEQRTLLFANNLSYDKAKATISANGNVEVSRGKITLFANKVTYDQNKDKIVASGNVRLVDAQNNITFTEYFEMSGDLKDGVSKTIRGIMADESLYAANNVKRTDATHNQFDQVVYSPCEVCRKETSKAPTWLIKSRHMVWNEDTGDITHADSTLEMWGVPVMYTPYLSHPGPTIKRRSGFLMPFFGGGGNLGAIIGVPYYWAIDNDKDLTVIPVYTRENPLLLLKYRHDFCKGHWELDTSVTKSRYQRGPKNRETSENKLRGHIKTKGHFSLMDNWFTGFNTQRALDDTYLKKYRFLGLGQDSFLTSRIYTETFWNRHYGLIEGISYQSLRQEDTSSRIPFIAPSAELHLLSQPTVLEGTFFLDSSFLNLQRRKGQNVKRFSTEGGWKAQWISSLGTVTDFGLQGRLDFYRVTNLLLNDGYHYSGQRNRLTPKTHAHLKYPFYKTVHGGRFIIEPVAGFVVTANNRNSPRTPNEDSSLFELSDANILSPNRITGLDVIDEWSRINYGTKFSYYAKEIGNSELFFGQSYSFAKVPKGFESTGLRSRCSDYVVRARYTYKDWVDLSSRLMLRKKDLNARRNESTVTVGQPIFNLRTTYTRFPKVTIPGVSVEQISYGFSSQFARHWSLTGDITRELGRKGGKLSQGGALTFEDSCFKFSTSLVKTFYQDRDYKPGITVMFRFSFKNLGEIQVSGDQFGLGQKAKPVDAHKKDMEKETANLNAAQ